MSEAASEDHVAFEPELGQAVFGNTPWFTRPVPGFVSRGLDDVAEAIEVARYGDADGWRTLTSNSGEEPYECSVFAMRSYCWCDGTLPGHAGGCPPNFEHFGSGLLVTWYKHSRRGDSMNRDVSGAEWEAIRAECMAAVRREGTLFNPAGERCGLCGDVARGSASVYVGDERVRLCHDTKRLTCYVRWTVYGERPT